jgi:malate dehydrogenase (oxaloacetate-decarboxylating)(NADP+)
MQPEMALDPERRKQYFEFSRLTRAANTLVFPYLDPANAAYQVLKVMGGASAVGPILLGLSKPCAALPNEVSAEDIVNMTAYVVLKAQQNRAREALRA